jgi:hypothetical protein
MSRTAISKKLRFEVFKRDSFTCQYCGKSAPDVVLHIDHIKPVSKDGDNEITNLITSCFDCNMGKKDRELSDDAVVQKRKRQLDELQERREQLTMMVDWQRSLVNLAEEECKEAIKFVNALLRDYSVNESGEKIIRDAIKKYGLSEVLESSRLSADQYLSVDKDGKHTRDSASKALDYIPRICNCRRRTSEKPYMKDLLYIRGIIRNRFNYYVDYLAIDLLEKAYLDGIDIEVLRGAATDCKNWSQWRDYMERITNG